ncbi:MAG: hypothetical protein ACQEUG_04330 [Pseudomonadota bacterium]
MPYPAARLLAVLLGGGEPLDAGILWQIRLLLLKDGRILDEGPPHRVLTHRRLSELYDMPISVRDLGDTLAVTPDYAACLAPDDRSRRAAGRQAAVHR